MVELTTYLYALTDGKKIFSFSDVNFKLVSHRIANDGELFSRIYHRLLFLF